MYSVQPGDFDPPVDRAKAKKALECVEELERFSRIKRAQFDISHDDLDNILKKYGFMK